MLDRIGKEPSQRQDRADRAKAAPRKTFAAQWTSIVDKVPEGAAGCGIILDRTLSGPDRYEKIAMRGVGRLDPEPRVWKPPRLRR